MNTSPQQVNQDNPTHGSISVVHIACPLCESPLASPLLKTRDYVYSLEGHYHFVQCNRCLHLYLNPRPDDASLAKCYPQDYAPHLAGSSNEPTAASSSAAEQSSSVSHIKKSRWRRAIGAIPLLKPFLFWLGQQNATAMPPLPMQDLSGGKDGSSGSPNHPELLEIGCAHGGFLTEARSAGWIADGLEPNEAAAEQARRRGFEVHTCTLSQAKLPDASRDAIVSWMVLEHVPDPREMVEESFRILRANGSFYISVPDGGGLERRLFGQHWLGYDAPRHLQVFTAKRLRTLLESSGFTNIRIIHQSSLRYTWGSIAAWGMDRWPAAKWPSRWMDAFIGEPPNYVRVLMLVPEKILAMLRLTGRMTVMGTKPGS